jgi:hypothetical protein
MKTRLTVTPAQCRWLREAINGGVKLSDRHPTRELPAQFQAAARAFGSTNNIKPRSGNALEDAGM